MELLLLIHYITQRRKRTMTKNESNKRLYYTVDGLYQLLTGCVSKQSIYYQIKTGKIPAKRFGEKPLIPASYVEDFLYGPIKVSRNG